MTLNALCLCMSHEKNVKVGKWSLQLLGKTGRPRQGVFEVYARKKASFETLSSLEVCSFTWQVLDPGRRRKSLWGGSGRTSDIKMLPNQICRATCCCDPLWIREQLKTVSVFCYWMKSRTISHWSIFISLDGETMMCDVWSYSKKI